MKLVQFLLILYIFVVLAGCSEERNVDYQLQEQCGKRCEEVFRNQYKDSGMKCSYKNHYNKKMNDCFILVSCVNGGIQDETLLDINENYKIGGISYLTKKMVSCSMLDKECKSKSEWNSLLKPYMEE
jgi:CTP:phosphocholine cytidylyltransferase-like protein